MNATLRDFDPTLLARFARDFWQCGDESPHSNKPSLVQNYSLSLFAPRRFSISNNTAPRITRPRTTRWV